MPNYRIQSQASKDTPNTSRNVLMEEAEPKGSDNYQVVTFAGTVDDAHQLQTLSAHLGEELESFLMENDAYGFQFLPQDSARLYLHVVFAPGDIDLVYDSFFALSQ